MGLKRKRSVGEDRSLKFIVRSVNLDDFRWFGLNDYSDFLYILTFHIMYIININTFIYPITFI